MEHFQCTERQLEEDFTTATIQRVVRVLELREQKRKREETKRKHAGKRVVPLTD